jgi:hypothetical protein
VPAITQQTPTVCDYLTVLCIILRDLTTSQLKLECACIQRYYLKTFYTSVFENTRRLGCWPLALPEMKALRTFETSATLYRDFLGSGECGNISSWKC